MPFRETVSHFYERHEIRFHLGFFALGFVFDYFAAQELDHPLAIFQQVLYLGGIAGILTCEYLISVEKLKFERFAKYREYRGLALHFFLGTLLNLYSFFFFKSASMFTSIVFVGFLLALIVANELPQVRRSEINIKWALFVVCLLSFSFMLYPKLLGMIGIIPLSLATITTSLICYLHFRWMMGQTHDHRHLSKAFLYPGLAVIVTFVAFDFMGWIPPVPLATRSMGIYHKLEKKDGHFYLSHERPAWKVWHQGDQDFVARPGDVLYFFTRIFSPAKFSEEIVIHWLYKDQRLGWTSADAVHMQVAGGREEGFRGYAVKQNYQPGSWRVQVETADHRELGRLYFTITADAADHPQQDVRSFSQDVF